MASFGSRANTFPKRVSNESCLCQLRTALSRIKACHINVPPAGDYMIILNHSNLEPHQPVTLTRLVSLGEGNTPLLSAKVFGREVYFKCEYINPTGSFKDRGTSTLVSFFLAGVTEAIEDSSGNAGASFAAYAAAGGNQSAGVCAGLCFGPKRKQIEAYGAELIPVPGPRTKASQAVMQAAETGMVYASHAYLPFNLPGYATCAYEIYEQLGRDPAR